MVMQAEDNGTGGQVPNQVPAAALSPGNWFAPDVPSTATPAQAGSGTTATGARKPPPMANTSPVVFGMPKRPSSTISRTPDSRDTGLSINHTSVWDATEQFKAWRDSPNQADRDRYDALVELMRAAGKIGPRVHSEESIVDKFNSVAKSAASRYAATGNPIDGDIYSYLNSLVGGDPAGKDRPSNGPGRRSGGGGGGGAGGVATNVNLTDPGTAHALADQMLSQYLGREANPQELALFKQALAANEMANPQQRVSAGSSSVTSGGFNAQEFAKEWAMGQKGVPEYQAATTFLDTFIQSLSDPTKVV